MTLRELAEHAKLSYSFISSLEKGRYNPSRESIYALATPLQADVNELLMLAGFLPDQTLPNLQHMKEVEKSFSDEPIDFGKIFELNVHFQGKKLTKSDKIALLSFLKTIYALKEPEN